MQFARVWAAPGTFALVSNTSLLTSSGNRSLSSPADVECTQWRPVSLGKSFCMPQTKLTLSILDMLERQSWCDMLHQQAVQLRERG